MDSMVMIIQSWNLEFSLGQLEEKIAATQAEGAQIMTEARWVSRFRAWMVWRKYVFDINYYITYLWYMRKMYYRYNI